MCDQYVAKLLERSSSLGIALKDFIDMTERLTTYDGVNYLKAAVSILENQIDSIENAW